MTRWRRWRRPADPTVSVSNSCALYANTAPVRRANAYARGSRKRFCAETAATRCLANRRYTRTPHAPTTLTPPKGAPREAPRIRVRRTVGATASSAGRSP